MENLPVSVEAMIEKGIQERFAKTFYGCPLVFTNASDKKQVIAKIKQDTGQGPVYPFAIAVLNNFQISTVPSYKAHTLMRHGLVSQSNSDSTVAYKLSLIPVESTYAIEIYHNSFDKVKLFAKRWMFATLGAKLNTTVAFGTADLDVRVEMDRSIPIPTREASPSEIQEYVATSNFNIQGYASEDAMEEVQAVTSVEIDGRVLSAEEILNGILAPGAGKQVFAFRNKWPAIPGPAASLGDEKDAFPSK